MEKRNNEKKIMVTGGLGFIGSHFVELALERGYSVINVDKKTYAIREDLEFDKNPSYTLIEKDICDLKYLPEGISHIVNFAAESHVENSIHDNFPFFKSNVQGVYNLLELVRTNPKERRPVLVHISTDEVYGDILEGSFSEESKLTPSNPYSATKAAADQLVIGWARTHSLRTRICRSSNNYGFGQRAEKLIPKVMKQAIKNIRFTVHGTGLYKREWTYVKDNCRAVLLVMEKGADSEIYNISSGEEHTNLEIVKKVLKVMGKPEDFYDFVSDRPGQDVRYSVTTDKIRKLGWAPSMTVDQYLPICKKQNEERTKNLGPGKKRKLARMLHIEKIFYA